MIKEFKKKIKIAILISGNGSNLDSIINTCKEPDTDAEVVVVISNNPRAPGLVKSKEYKIPSYVVDHKSYSSRLTFEKALDEVIRKYDANFICNAGFMRILSSWFVNKWYNKQINIHPSLLPAYPGLNTHERVLNEGIRFTGCTIHFIRTGLDNGPRIIQSSIPVFPTDVIISLKRKVLTQENLIYPIAIRLLAKDKIKIINEKVIVENQIFGAKEQINPLVKL